MLKISTTPHIFSPVTTQSLMRDVLIALTPAIIVALLMFGIGALKVLLTSVAACVMFEYLITRYLLKTANGIRRIGKKYFQSRTGRTCFSVYFLSRTNDHLAQT